MRRVTILPLMGLLAVAIALAVIFFEDKPATSSSQSLPAFQPPFDSYIAGTGITEAPTGNIAIGTPVSGIVMEIYVKVGDRVTAGRPLFKIDDRDLQAQLVGATAQVTEANASLQIPKHKLENAEHLRARDKAAISTQDLVELRDITHQAEAELELARARLSQLQLEIEMHTVRAPVAGEILQLRLHPGEYIEGSSVAPHLLLLGGNNKMNLRVDVDEHDAWRFQTGAKAIAFVRGHPELKIPLHYEYTEPYVIPKSSLSGLSTERTDTRVLQVIYSFEHPAITVFIGQQLDAYIEVTAGKGHAAGE